MTIVDDTDAFYNDVLHGADEIARFLYGPAGDRRKVYRIVRKRFPAFRLGGEICARRSRLLAWIEAQEEQPR